MILSKLDSPFELPQLMAFSVNSEELNKARAVFKKLLATNDWVELHQVGLLNRNALSTEIHRYQFLIQSKWLNEIVKNLNLAAGKFEIVLEHKVDEGINY